VGGGGRGRFLYPLPALQNGEEPLREFWMNEEKGLHLGRNGVPSIQIDAQTDLLN
jgi:hypothetical protein